MAHITRPQSHNMGKESYLLNLIMPTKKYDVKCDIVTILLTAQCSHKCGIHFADKSCCGCHLTDHLKYTSL
jgi:hypothetical protein